MTSTEYNITSAETVSTEWSVAKARKEGEQECADVHLVKTFGDSILFVAADGLGHGSKAARASQKAINFLKHFAGGSLITLLNNCHEKLKGTRGAVMSLALFNCRKNNLSWLGVGNVEGVLMCKNGKNRYQAKQLILHGGVVGYRMPPLSVSIETISPGDILIFATDGVKSDYIEHVDTNKRMQDIVRNVAKKTFKSTDDSLVLAARFKGEGGSYGN